MYVTISGKDKYRVIQFREDIRILGTTKWKAHVVKTIGNYEQLLAKNPNILKELKEQAKRLTLAKKNSSAPVTLEVSTEDILDTGDVVPSYYFGHALVLQLWNKLKLEGFFAERSGKRDAQKVIEAIIGTPELHLVLARGAVPHLIGDDAVQVVIVRGYPVPVAIGGFEQPSRPQVEAAGDQVLTSRLDRRIVSQAIVAEGDTLYAKFIYAG